MPPFRAKFVRNGAQLWSNSWTPAASAVLILLAGTSASHPADGPTGPEVDLPTAGPLHDGPRVGPPGGEESTRGDFGPTSAGPARFVGPIYRGFSVAGALGDATYIDGFYRTPASPLYDACLDRLHATFANAGFGKSEALTLRWIESEEPEKAWWPESGLLELTFADGDTEILLAFAQPGDAHRTMLPVGAPNGSATGPIALQSKDMAPGSILVTRAPLSRQMVERAAARGAGAVLSATGFEFTKDPSGGDRHLDAIQFKSAPRGVTLPVGQISPRVMTRIEEAELAGGATLRFVSRTKTAERTLRTLVAEVVGETAPHEAVVIASHLQEPGAGDNAAGTAGLAGAAVAVAQAIEKGSIARPKRTLVFVIGDEMRQSRIWLNEASRTAVAALSADMLGQNQERTGSVALLERTPDPGALFTIPPDKHTAWGAGRVNKKDIIPNGLNVICREAFADVTALVGEWKTSENPWEGGSDHDIFNRAGIPGALMWHFTDYTYHTSLDRMDMIDGEELRRTCTAIVSAALSMCDPSELDLARHLTSNEFERAFRVQAAEAADHAEAALAWEAWCDGTADWLRRFAVPSVVGSAPAPTKKAVDKATGRRK